MHSTLTRRMLLRWRPPPSTHRRKFHNNGRSFLCSPEVVVIGASVMDLIAYSPKLPAPGETVMGTGFQSGFGGKGANQAVQASKLGTTVGMITKIGADAFGRQTLENFERIGVDCQHVTTTAEAETGVAPFVVDERGRNAIVVCAGANDHLCADDVEAARDVIARASILVCQLEIPLTLSLAAMKIARDAGTTTILNTAPAPASGLDDAFFELADICCPNESEIELLTGVSVGASLEDAAGAARRLLDRGCRSVILTLGARGALYVTEGEETHFPGDASVTPIDTVGAGDCFIGSLSHFLAAGHDLHEAIRRAGAVAEISIQGRGTQTSFPSARELPGALTSR